MPKRGRKAKKSTKKKREKSDILICYLENGGYSVHPSTFIVHDRVKPIYFRNLTSSTIQLLLKEGPVSPSTLTLRPDARRRVSVDESADPGIYEYKVKAPTPPRIPGIRQLPKTYAQGSSSPKMIIDA